jgi:hypothetical protein
MGKNFPTDSHGGRLRRLEWLSSQKEKFQGFVDRPPPPSILNCFLAIELKLHAKEAVTPLHGDLSNKPGQVADAADSHEFKFDP